MSVELVARNLEILGAMNQDHCLSQDHASQYFDNLENIFRTIPKLLFPGRVVLGLATGRCGTATLTSILRLNASILATHENPCMFSIYAETRQEDLLAFHFKRFDFLRQYYPVVFDIAPMWIGYLFDARQKYPDLQIIGMHRDTKETIKSFQKVDFAPSEDTQDAEQLEILSAISEMIHSYNDMLFRFMDRMTEHEFLLVDTNKLSLISERLRIFTFLGYDLPPQEWLSKDIWLNREVMNEGFLWF